MEGADVITLLAAGEGTRIEFKTRIEPIARDVCAFLNTDGGTVLCGVTDDGGIEGVTERNPVQRVADTLQKVEPVPGFEVVPLDLDGRHVVAVVVQPSPYLHSVGNVAYVRAGANNRPLSIHDVLERASESLFVFFDEQPSPAPVEELDQEAFRAFLEQRERLRGVPVRGDLQENLRRLRVAVARDGRRVLTYAGLLAFGEAPNRFLPQSRIQVVRFTDANLERYSDTRLFEGSVGSMIDEVEAYLAANLREFGGHAEGFRRGRVLEYPLGALREAIVNAVAHRNYLDASDIKLFITPNSIRIKNPGSFPPGVTPEEPEHKPRNPLLMGYLYDLGYVERYGFGIERIREACAAHPFVEVEYRLGTLRTEVVFTHNGGQLDLDDVDQRLLRYLGGKARASGEIAAHLGVSRQTVNTRVRRLESMHLVRREGAGRATRYRLG